MSKTNDRIVEELAEEFNLPHYVIRWNISSFYRILRDFIRERDVMDESTLKGMYVPGFGRFMPKSKYSLDIVRKRKKAKIEREKKNTDV